MGWKRVFVVILIALFLPQCTWRSLIFRNAAFVLKWEIDSYFDLTRQQKRIFNEKIEGMVADFMRDEVPVLLGQLNEFDQRLADGIQPEDVEWANARLRDMRLTLYDRYHDIVLTFLQSLSTEQIDHFAKKMRARNAKVIRFTEKLSPDDLESEMWDESIDAYENWFGSLTKAQATELKKTHFLQAPSIKAHLAQKLQAEERFVTFLREGSGADPMKATLRAWIMDPAGLRMGSERETYLQQRADWPLRVAGIGAIAGERGNKHLREKILDIARDLKSACKCEPTQFSEAKSPTAAATTRDAAKVRIVLLGDSLTAGYGVAIEEAFPAVLARKLEKLWGDGFEVVNAGVSGSTSASGLSRLRWHLKANPSHVVVALGANDGLRGIKVTETKKNLAEILQLAKESNLPTLLVGMELPPNYGETYAEEFRNMFADLAKERQLLFMPFLLKDVGGQKDLNQPDGIHPNGQGHQVIAQNLWPYIIQLLGRSQEPQ